MPLTWGQWTWVPLGQWVELRCWPSPDLDQRLERLQGADVVITNKSLLDAPC